MSTGTRGGMSLNKGDQSPAQGNIDAKKNDGDAEAAVPGPPRVSQIGVPICVMHNCSMIASSTKGTTTHYQCPAGDCKASDKITKPATSVFARPMECPRRACQERKEKSKGKETSFLIKDIKRSSANYIEMKCPDPNCDFHVSVPNPAVGEFFRKDPKNRGTQMPPPLIGER